MYLSKGVIFMTRRQGESMSQPSEVVNFEKKIEELEGVIEQLESGKLSLQKSLSEFEKGVKLYSECKKVLDQAEKKVTTLTDQLKEVKVDD